MYCITEIFLHKFMSNILHDTVFNQRHIKHILLLLLSETDPCGLNTCEYGICPNNETISTGDPPLTSSTFLNCKISIIVLVSVFSEK